MNPGFAAAGFAGLAACPPAGLAAPPATLIPASGAAPGGNCNGASATLVYFSPVSGLIPAGTSAGLAGLAAWPAGSALPPLGRGLPSGPTTIDLPSGVVIIWLPSSSVCTCVPVGAAGLAACAGLFLGRLGLLPGTYGVPSLLVAATPPGPVVSLLPSPMSCVAVLFLGRLGLLPGI